MVAPFNTIELITDNEALLKIKAQLGKSEVINDDPTTSFTNKIQKHLSKLRKEDKFDKKTYYKLYPSDPIPPRLYGTIKAHKPEKDYPMRTIVSTIGTPPYGISKYLVEIIQPTLNKNEYKVTNSTTFVEEAKQWRIEPTEVQVSYDIVNLYPSVPVNKALDVLIDQLNSDKRSLEARTKLSLKDIYELSELCLTKCYFLWNNKIRILRDAGQ